MTLHPNFSRDRQPKLPGGSQEQNTFGTRRWETDCTTSYGQSLKACLMYVNISKIRRIFEALGIAKLEWSLTKIIFFVVHLVLPISECDGNTARTASVIAV